MSDCPQISLSMPDALGVSFFGPCGTNLAITGGGSMPYANLTGLGGLTIYSSGSTIFISGGAGAGEVTEAELLAVSGALVSQIYATSAGVLALNGQSGVLTLQGLNGVSIFGSGQTIFISGSAGSLSTGDLSGYVRKSQQINGYSLTGDVTVTATDIPVGIVPGAGFSNLQQFINTMHSPGLIEGAVLSDAGSGNLAISAGTGMLRVADDNVSSLLFVTIPPAILAVPQDLVQYYAGFAYNTGNPQFQLRSADNWDNDTEIPLGTVVNFFGTLVVKNNPFLVGDPITNIIQRFDAMAPIVRDEIVGGMIIGENTGRHITLSEGKLWTRLNDYEVPAMNTAGTDVMYAAYYNGLYWTYNTPTTQWDNTSYNDISVGLLPIPIFYYSALWFYITVESNALGYIYDQNIYADLTTASLASPPSFLPANFTVGSILLGRLIFQNGSTSAVQLDSSFDTQFSPAPITTHNNLAGLQGGATNEYYHLSQAQYTVLTGDASLPTVVTLNGLSGAVGIVGAGNVSASLSGNNIVVSGSAEAGSYITTGQTGQFASAAALTQTGIDLLALIAGSSAGVSSVNSATGALLITGAGNITVTRNGELFVISGDTGAYVEFATNSQLTQTGAILDGRIAISGNAAVNHANSIGTILSGALTTTGVTLAARDLIISGQLYTGIAQTGSTLNTQTLGLSGYLISLISAASAGVSSLNASSGVLNLVGTGGLVVLTNGQTILVSGNLDPANFPTSATVTGMSGSLMTTIVATGTAAIVHVNGIGSILSGLITQTGVSLGAKIDVLSGFTTGVSGFLQAQIATLPTSANLALTGSDLYVLVTGLSGSVNALVIGTGASIVAHANAIGRDLSGNLVATGLKISALSGFVESGFLRNINATGFITGMATGVFEQYINHFAFSRIPYIQLTADYINVPMVYLGVSGRSATGFYVLYSDTVLETGNSLMVWASV